MKTPLPQTDPSETHPHQTALNTEPRESMPGSNGPAGVLSWMRGRLGHILQTQAALTTTTLLVLMAFFSVLFPTQFPSAFNLEHLVIDYSSIVILGVGVTFAQTSGQFDLSVGATLVLASVTSAKVMVALADNSWVVVAIGFAVALAVGIIVGIFNGFLVAQAHIPSIIVTLGSSTVGLGLAFILVGGQDIRNIPDVLVDTIGFGRLFGVIPNLVLIAVVVVVSGHCLLTMTRFGRHTAALGSNMEAARRAGINVVRLTIQLYVISGLTAALAGFLSLALFHATSVGGHTTDSLTALLGVVLGGTSLFGGVGTVLGTAVGVYIPGVLSNGMILMDIFPYWQQVLVGLVLIGVVYVDIVKRRNRDR